MKTLGNLAGLTHCQSGSPDCLQSEEPKPDSAMYRVSDTGKKETIAQDEVSGIQSIYGKFSLPFPVSGTYALTDSERKTLIDLIRMEETLGYATPEGRIALGEQLKTNIRYNKIKTGRELRIQFDEVHGMMKSQLSMFDENAKLLQRDLLIAGIYTAVRTKEDALRGYNTMDTGFIDYTIDRHMETFRLTIDSLGGVR